MSDTAMLDWMFKHQANVVPWERRGFVCQWAAMDGRPHVGPVTVNQREAVQAAMQQEQKL